MVFQTSYGMDVGLGDSLGLLATERADPESAPEDLEQGGRRVGQQAWAYAGYDRGQETRRQRSTRLGPEQAAGAAVGVEGLGVEPCR